MEPLDSCPCVTTLSFLNEWTSAMKLTLPTLILVIAASHAEPSDTLASRVAAARQSGGPTWLSWSVPSTIDGVACCWDGSRSRHSETCSLSNDNYGMNMSSEDGRPSDTTLTVYAHVQGGAIDKVRIFSNSCQVDRGGELVEEITGVRPAESVGALEALIVGSENDRAMRRVADGAMMAIALHDDKSADRALEHVAKGGGTKQLRRSAAFWLGNTREQAGYEALLRLRASEDASFREHLTFAFSQSRAKGAPATLIDMARNDPSPKVRGQALFWIAQRAQKKSDADVIRAAVDDPDADIKKKAVFALSQMPRGEGVPDLIRVAQEARSREVRKQAMFWLGQSRDPRALAFFEKILSQ